MGKALTWDEIVDHCSRLHTTRTRQEPWRSEPREDSHTLAVMVDGRPATIVPTRMHEPGFYWRYEDVPEAEGTMRSDEHLDRLHHLAGAGLIVGRELVTDNDAAASESGE